MSRDWAVGSPFLYDFSGGISMIKYILKRILMIIPVVLFVSFVVYGVMDLVPGDPALTALGRIFAPQLRNKPTQ